MSIPLQTRIDTLIRRDGSVDQFGFARFVDELNEVLGELLDLVAAQGEFTTVTDSPGGPAKAVVIGNWRWRWDSLPSRDWMWFEHWNGGTGNWDTVRVYKPS